MNFFQLQNFQAVARLGNISKAAEELHMTQPNLSSSLTRLEDELGFPLFERRKGKISLNQCGKVFLDSVNKIVDEMSNAINSARAVYEKKQNIIRVASSMSDTLGKVLENMPLDGSASSIQQFQYTNSQCIQAVLDGSVDIAIISLSGPSNIKEINFVQLGCSERVLLVNSKHPLAAQEKISVFDVKNENFICNMGRDDTEFFHMLQAGFGISPNITGECDNEYIELMLAKSGLGMSFIPYSEYYKLKDTETGQATTIIHFEEKLPDVMLGYIYRNDYMLTDFCKLFCSKLEEFFSIPFQIRDTARASYW